MAALWPTATDLMHLAVWVGVWLFASLCLGVVWALVGAAIDSAEKRGLVRFDNGEKFDEALDAIHEASLPRRWEEPAVKGFSRRNAELRKAMKGER